MKIIQPSFELSTPFGPLTEEVGIQMLRFIEKQARISHRSEDAQTEDSWKRFIKAVVLEHGDWSVVEHASVTATIRTERGTTHQLVRHRLFSFTQESTRFVRYRGDLEFICPEWFDAHSTDVIPTDNVRHTWNVAVKNAEQDYHELLSRGARPQDARSILPNSLASTIAVTGNLRNWRHFFLMRTSRETQNDFTRVTIPMLERFKQVVPLLFDDIEPNARQIDNLRKAR